MEPIWNALLLASSSEVTQVKEGEQLIANLSSMPGFYSGLAMIANNKVELPSSLGGVSSERLSAAMQLTLIQLKNGVDKFWRRLNATDASEEERTSIKACLLSERVLEEQDDNAAVLFAVIVSKIARFDCPNQWSDLLPTLMRRVEWAAANDVETLNKDRSLLMFYHVIKTLSVKKLPGDRAFFRQLSEELFPTAQQLCKLHHEKLLASISSPCKNTTQEESKLVSNCLLIVKIIRKLVTHGFTRVREMESVLEFLKSILTTYLPIMLKVSKVLFSTQSIVVNHCKLLHDLLYNDPLSYAPLVTESMKFLITTLFTQVSEEEYFDKFLLQAFNLFKLILLCEEFQPKEGLVHLEHPLTLEARTAIDAAMCETLSTTVNVCIQKYLPIAPSQIERWNDNPETFFNENETGDSWQSSLPSCIESFFITLSKQNISVSKPVILSFYQKLITTDVSSSLQTLQDTVALESILCTMGLVLYDIKLDITLESEFFTFCETIAYASSTERAFIVILKRRVCWFISQWIMFGFLDDLIPRLLQLLVRVLSNEKDAAVLLTASKTLKILYDDMDVPTEVSSDCIGPVITCLRKLLASLEEDQSKCSVLSTLTLIIDRARFSVLPFTETILTLLLEIWGECEPNSEQFLQASVVQCLSFVASGLKHKSLEILPSVKPILIYSIDFGNKNDSGMHLMLDGLELLSAFVQNVETGNSELMGLFPLVLPVLELGEEYVKMALNVINSYFLLFKAEVSQVYEAQICTAFISLFNDTSKSLLIHLVQTIRTYCRLCVPHGVNPSMDGRSVAVASDALKQMLGVLLQAVVDQDGSSLMLADLIGMFSYLALPSPPAPSPLTSHIFATVIQVHATQSDVSPESVLSRVIGIFCDCLDDIVDIRTKKLAGLGLLYLMDLSRVSSELVSQRLVGIVYACLDCMHDLADPDTGVEDVLIHARATDSGSPLKGPFTSPGEADYVTAEDHRLAALDRDCVTSVISLQDVLRTRLAELRASPGLDLVQIVQSGIDEQCQLQLKSFLDG